MYLCSLDSNLSLLVIIYFQITEAPATELSAIAFEADWIRLVSEAGEDRALTVSVLLFKPIFIIYVL